MEGRGDGGCLTPGGDLEGNRSRHGHSRFCLPGAAPGKTAPAGGAGGAGAGGCLVSGTGPLQHPGKQRDCSAAGLGARVLFSIWCDRAARPQPGGGHALLGSPRADRGRHPPSRPCSLQAAASAGAGGSPRAWGCAAGAGGSRAGKGQSPAHPHPVRQGSPRGQGSLQRCSCAAALPGCHCPARAPAVQQGLTSAPAPSSPTGEGGAGEETWARLLDEVSIPSLPCAQPPAAGLPAVG